MRIAFLSCVILLFAHTAFAASRLPQSTSGSDDSKPPAAVYSKGKGTIGLVCALVLGPVGWLGVRMLSRNKTQRKKANRSNQPAPLGGRRIRRRHFRLHHAAPSEKHPASAAGAHRQNC
jgi:hypothetical protein